MTARLVQFYAVVAVICFVLLGFLWVTVHARGDAGRQPATARRLADIVSLHFSVIGVMSLIAVLVEEDTPALWRVTFGLGGLVGIVASAFVLFDWLLRAGRPTRFAYLGHFVAGPLYIAITYVAAVPELVRLAFGVRPLVVEAIVIGILLLVMTHLAWSLFTERQHGVPATGTRGPTGPHRQAAPQKVMRPPMRGR